MFATLLAALAVVIALQALRLASRDRIVIHVAEEPVLAPKTVKSPELPPFLVPKSPPEPSLTDRKPDRLSDRLPAESRTMVSFTPGQLQPGRPIDIHLN